MSRGGLARRLEGFAFVGPFLFVYGLVLIYPLLLGIGVSFHRADLFGARRWVGLENYAMVLSDPVFHQALSNTLVLALLIVPPLTVIALLLALALNRATRGAAIFRGSSSPPRSCRSRS
jgi:multiple sugar transport system permease protein